MSSSGRCPKCGYYPCRCAVGGITSGRCAVGGMTSGRIELKRPELYEIDWDKINTLSELKFVLSSLNITFTLSYERYEKVKEFLKLKEH